MSSVPGLRLVNGAIVIGEIGNEAINEGDCQLKCSSIFKTSNMSRGCCRSIDQLAGIELEGIKECNSWLTACGSARDI